jgi:hypothetical protein
MSASSGAGIASNSATSTIESVGTLVGPLLAAALVSLSDNGVVFVVGAGALLAAALLLGRVRIETRVDLTAEPSDLGTLQIIGAGFGAVSRSPNARLLVGLAVAQTFVRGCLNVLIVIAVFGVLHGSAAEVGYLTAAIGVGGLIGALGAMALEGRRLAALFGLALVTWGVPIILIHPRPRRRLGPRDGCRSDRVDRSTGHRGRDSHAEGNKACPFPPSRAQRRRAPLRRGQALHQQDRAPVG